MEIVAMNKAGEKPVALDETVAPAPAGPVDLATQEDLTRFDRARKKKKKKKNRDRSCAPNDSSSAPS